MGEHYSHLDIRERAVVEMNLALGKCPAQIAVYLSRSRSTITREMARNGWHAAYYDRGRRRIAAGGYRCERADLRAARLSRRARVERRSRVSSRQRARSFGVLHPVCLRGHIVSPFAQRLIEPRLPNLRCVLVTGVRLEGGIPRIRLRSTEFLQQQRSHGDVAGESTVGGYFIALNHPSLDCIFQPLSFG